MASIDRHLEELEKIKRRLNAFMQQDIQITAEFEQTESEIAGKYQTKLQSLANTRVNREQIARNVVAHDAQEIQKAEAEIARLEANLPPKFRHLSLSTKTRATSGKPDFQELNVLLSRINEPTFNAKIKRTFNLGKYYRRSAMARDFLSGIVEAKTFLNGEKANDAAYLAAEQQEANRQYQDGRTDADGKKAQFLQQNNSLYDMRTDALQQEFLTFMDGPQLQQIEQAILTTLTQLGAFAEDWEEYVPALDYPEEIMLGALEISFSFLPQIDNMLAERLPLSYKKGLVLLPFAAPFNKPIQLQVLYNPDLKKNVMGGIQSIISRLLRFLPPFSYFITCIDPGDRGTNFGELQKLASTSALGVYTTKEDIAKKLKELERFVDQSSAAMAGIVSIYEYNRKREPAIPHQIVVINDYPDGLDRSAMESLSILIKNSYKCGISIIITSAGTRHADIPDLNGLRITSTSAKTEINYAGKNYGFVFDSQEGYCAAFVERMRKLYTDGLRIDNRFPLFFTLDGPGGFRDSSESLMIPFAVDSRRRLIELELGSPLTAHALLSGSIGSGKSTTLHMLITSILLNYHPDDVELWLVDYKKVEFAEYEDCLPPHVKLLALERGAEFTYSMLDYIDAEFQRRLELFKSVGVNNITEYKRKFGVRSLPRIVLIIDEFHNMTQAIQSEKQYVQMLENILSEYRVFGLSCIFSDQAVSDGLRGLTEKGKKQIRTRIAMVNDPMEVRETLALDSSFFDDALRAKINKLDKGDVIFKRMVYDENCEMYTILDKYKTVLTTREERRSVCRKAAETAAGGTERKKSLIVDGQGRKRYDNTIVEEYEARTGVRAGLMHITVGTPASLDPCFQFYLREKLDSNIMIIGSDDDLRGSTLLYTMLSFSRQDGNRIIVFADANDEMYRLCLEALPRLDLRDVQVCCELAEICAQIDWLAQNVQSKNPCRTLVVWLGLEALADEFSLLQEKNNDRIRKQPPSMTKSLIDDLLAGINDKLLEYDEGKPSLHVPTEDCIAKVAESAYDARGDVQEIISKGPRYGIFNLVTYSSVKLIRQVKCVKPEHFEHKIAFNMSMEDSSTYLGKGQFASGLDEFSGVYSDGGTEVSTFRPYLLPQ